MVSSPFTILPYFKTEAKEENELHSSKFWPTMMCGDHILFAKATNCHVEAVKEEKKKEDTFCHLQRRDNKLQTPWENVPYNSHSYNI